MALPSRQGSPQELIRRRVVTFGDRGCSPFPAGVWHPLPRPILSTAIGCFPGCVIEFGPPGRTATAAATSWTGGHTLVALAAPEAAGPARVSCPGKKPETLRWEGVCATIAVRGT